MGTSFDVRFAALTCRRTYAALVVFRLIEEGKEEEEEGGKGRRAIVF